MYTFTDKGGRSLTLRPEYTPSVVRAIIEHRLDLQPEPMRYYYMGPMFRYDKPQKGRYRQFHQVDIEVFGEKDAAVDAEIIEMADSLLRRLGVAGTETLVNSVGCRACRPAYIQALQGGREAQVRALPRLPEKGGDQSAADLRLQGRVLPGGRPLLPGDHRTFSATNAGTISQSSSTGLDVFKIPYRVDPRLVRGLDYYTKTTFEIVSAASAPRTPCSAAAATTT